MSTSILNVGQSALQAAQIGLTTTGHNIANANTPGYSRQVVMQQAALAQNIGAGFVGSGTEVVGVRRVYDQFLNTQVLSAQTSKSALDSYSAQISQIDNMLGDSTTGVPASLQDFFSGVQDLASNPNSAASRQEMLSSAQTLASSFQEMGSQLNQIHQDINDQINSDITSINSYAQQISTLNDAIEKAQGTSGDAQPANDLQDQRDQLVSDLSKVVKVSVVQQGNSYNVFIGNGQPLVVGTRTMTLAATVSQTDPSRAEVGVSVSTNGVVTMVPESTLTGGSLGGVLDFRSQSLDAAQNALGRVATGIAMTFNAQHELGQDQNGDIGGAFFSVGAPVVNASSNNTGNGTVSASIADPNALTTSDYLLQTVSAAVPPASGSYKITRLSDGATTTFSSFPQTVDGVVFDLSSGSPATGDSYLIKPTAEGASGFGVAITDTAKIAAAAPVATAAVAANTGSGKISAGSVSATTIMPSLTLTYAGGNLTGFPSDLPVSVTNGSGTTTYAAGTPVPYSAGDVIKVGGVQISGIPAAAGSYSLSPPATLTYDATTSTLSGFPSYLDVTVTHNGTQTTYSAGTPVPYSDGDTISYGGLSFSISGAPADGDQFTVGANTNGLGDNRNALLLGALQTSNTLANGTASYQVAYAQMVSMIGNKAHEVSVNSTAQGNLLDSAVAAQQSVSGVNLDEEATNLLRYQQAYQAAGKVMQTASQLFDFLLTIGQA